MGRLTERVINQVKKTKSHKKKKQTMKKKLFKTRLLSFAAFCGLTFAFASCANEDVAQNPNSTDNDKNLTTFSAGAPTTRTSMESNGKFFWEAGDKIYVKDDNGAWNASSNSPTGKTDNFKFKVPGTYTAHNSYEVYYPGQGGSNDQAVIAASQSQAEPNTTTHFGAAGDCGMATATKVSGKQQFAFTLDHKAAYLLFLPRTSNTILNKCYLTKVEVNSDNDITDTYTLDPTTGKLTGTGTGKQIVLNTKGSGTYVNGFPLTNASASAATNGAYMVIKPGTHTLKIRYWVKDVATNVEGTITKTLSSATYDQNKYYNITANLNVKDYDGDHYYMWDAQEQYWKDYEWSLGGSQPTLSQGLSGATSSSNYPFSNTDPRYYNKSYPGWGISNLATHTSCKDLPNINEMTWYAAMAIHVGTETKYGLPWVVYIKAVCGLRRSQYCKPKVITTATQPTTALIGVQMDTLPPGPHLILFLPQPMQTTTFTCPPWVTTTLVSCTTSATAATIGRQLLTLGTC